MVWIYLAILSEVIHNYLPPVVSVIKQDKQNKQTHSPTLYSLLYPGVQNNSMVTSALLLQPRKQARGVTWDDLASHDILGHVIHAMETSAPVINFFYVHFFKHVRVLLDLLIHLAKFQSIKNIRSHFILTFISKNLRPPLISIVQMLGCEWQEVMPKAQKYLGLKLQ